MSDNEEEKFGVHYYGSENTSYGLKRGEMVGGPYSTKQRARNSADKKDSAYGGYVHRVMPYRLNSDKGDNQFKDEEE